MTKQKIHVAFLGTQKTLEQLAIRRSIDELIIVYPQEKTELAGKAIEYFSSFGITVESVCVLSHDFYNTLSSILSALNHRKLDDYQIEFSITSEHSTIILAACVAAAIAKASILCATEMETLHISEVWPSELVNLTLKKREILDYLENSGFPVAQKEISRNTGIRQSGISRHIRDLELAGFVERDRVARIKKVQITELGSVILHHKQLRKRRVWDAYSNRSVEGVQTVG
ncbi:MAG: winged helix-turn-helix domain-containing protein [Candidatus Thorarchaeota archaeon]|nr:winged helix-turn-helix domain-containing protein [Candidatus Thorarchaeota archaeon]